MFFFGATITIGFVMLEVLQHPSSLYCGVILQERANCLHLADDVGGWAVQLAARKHFHKESMRVQSLSLHSETQPKMLYIGMNPKTTK